MPIRASRKRLREQRAVGERADLAARGHPPDFSGRSQPEVDVAVGIDGQAFWELEGGRVEIDDRGDVFGKNGNRDHRPCQRDHHQDRQQFSHLGFLADCIVTQSHLESLLSSVDQGLARAKKDLNKQADVKNGSKVPFAYGIIGCAMRMFTDGVSDYFKNLFELHPHLSNTEMHALASLDLVRGLVKIRDEKGYAIVGFDLAGAEKGHPAEDHHLDCPRCHVRR